MLSFLGGSGQCFTYCVLHCTALLNMLWYIFLYDTFLYYGALRNILTKLQNVCPTWAHIRCRQINERKKRKGQKVLWGMQFRHLFLSLNFHHPWTFAKSSSLVLQQLNFTTLIVLKTLESATSFACTWKRCSAALLWLTIAFMKIIILINLLSPASWILIYHFLIPSLKFAARPPFCPVGVVPYLVCCQTQWGTRKKYDIKLGHSVGYSGAACKCRKMRDAMSVGSLKWRYQHQC